MSEVLLEIRGLEKTFPGVRALKGVQLTVNKGEVHSLMGENGAGKSTSDQSVDRYLSKKWRNN